MAQKLKFGNGTWATKEGSTLAYNDENNNYKPLPFTTTRNSIATRVNKEGLIEVVGNDVPRIDYTDSSEGVLLLEPQRTNLIPHSEYFGSWGAYSAGTGSNPIITSNYATSPDGNLNAARIQFNRGSGTTYADTSYIDYGLSAGTIAATLSVYLKTNDGSTKDVTLRLGASIFDYSVSVTPEWKRFILSGNTSVDRMQILLYGNQNSQTADLSCFGAQVEQGSYATSYIPTYGSTVTRQADTASGAGNSEVFNSEQGTLFVDLISSGGTTDGYISISDLTTNNRLAIRIGYNNSNQVSLFMVSNGGSSEFEEFYNVGSLGFRNFNKFALKYKVNDVSLFFNGFEVITISSAAMASGFKSLNFANATGGTQPFYGKTKEIGYYDTALTDEELEYLTSYRSLNELVTVLNLNEL